MIRRASTALLVAAVSVFLAQAPASGGGGGGSKFPTRVSIKIERDTGQDVFVGKVRSKHRACESNRPVKLKHRAVKWQEKATIVARPRTGGDGKWTFKAKKNTNGENYATPGYYHVRVGEKKIGTGDGEIVCKEKYSSPLYIG